MQNVILSILDAIMKLSGIFLSSITICLKMMEQKWFMPDLTLITYMKSMITTLKPVILFCILTVPVNILSRRPKPCLLKSIRHTAGITILLMLLIMMIIIRINVIKRIKTNRKMKIRLQEMPTSRSSTRLYMNSLMDYLRQLNY